MAVEDRRGWSIYLDGHRSSVDGASTPCLRMAKRCVDASLDRRSRTMRDDARCDADARSELRCRDGARHRRCAGRRSLGDGAAHCRDALRCHRRARGAPSPPHVRAGLRACRKALPYAAFRQACGFSLVSSLRYRQRWRRSSRPSSRGVRAQCEHRVVGMSMRSRCDRSRGSRSVSSRHAMRVTTARRACHRIDGFVIAKRAHSVA